MLQTPCTRSSVLPGNVPLPGPWAAPGGPGGGMLQGPRADRAPVPREAASHHGAGPSPQFGLALRATSLPSAPPLGLTPRVLGLQVVNEKLLKAVEGRLAACPTALQTQRTLLQGNGAVLEGSISNLELGGAFPTWTRFAPRARHNSPTCCL